jgi:SagB-type dehydrogenase family enzyme
MNSGKQIKLPPPKVKGQTSLEEAIAKRSSVREYSAEALSIAHLSQLLWAAQGITHGDRFRAAPSAGSTYPLELFVVAGRVEGLAAGMYRYDVPNHSLYLHMEGDQRQKLIEASSFKQGFIAQAPVDIIICGVYRRTTDLYGQWGVRYVHMDTGHAAENIALQAVALGLDTVMVGAFDDDELSTVMNLPEELAPMYIIPVGKAG